MTNEPYGYVWTSIKDGMETRFTRMYPNDFYKPTDITPVYKAHKPWVDLTEDEMVSLRSQVQEYTALDSVKYGEAIQRAMAKALKEKNNA